MSREMFLRLWVRAPRILMKSIMLLLKLSQPANIPTFAQLAQYFSGLSVNALIESAIKLFRY
jgi:hypothetical protein